jgi:hypothetical protein
MGFSSNNSLWATDTGGKTFRVGLLQVICVDIRQIQLESGVKNKTEPRTAVSLIPMYHRQLS